MILKWLGVPGGWGKKRYRSTKKVELFIKQFSAQKKKKTSDKKTE